MLFFGILSCALLLAQGIFSTLSAMFRPEIESGAFVGNADIITKLPLLRWVITSDLASKRYPLVR
jgi:hypothetical protein